MENCDNDGGNDRQSDSELCGDGCSEVVQQTGEMVRRITTGTVSSHDSHTAAHDEGIHNAHVPGFYLELFFLGGRLCLKGLYSHIHLV